MGMRRTHAKARQVAARVMAESKLKVTSIANLACRNSN